MLEFNIEAVGSLVITPVLVGVGIYFGKMINNYFKRKSGIIFESEIITHKTLKELLSELRIKTEAFKIGLYQFINGNKFTTGKSVYKTVLTAHSVKPENIELEHKIGFKTREFTVNLIPSILKEVNDNCFIFCRFDLVADHNDEIYYLGGNSNTVSFVGKIGIKNDFYGILVIHIPVENMGNYEDIINIYKKYNLKIFELLKKTDSMSIKDKIKNFIFKKEKGNDNNE